jgi:outer membrane protein assembly factor BamB
MPGSVSRSIGTLASLVATIVAVASPAPVAASDVRAHITLVSPSSVSRSGPVTISGTGFGTRSDGVVTIGGVRAWTTTWTDSQVVAYVPERSALGDARVEINADGKKTNAARIDVSARREVGGTIAWRFETLANYISHRAAVGADGTVYFNDSSGFLYALSPDGALLWVYDGESVGSSGPTVLGKDGTIYFGVSAPNGAIHAVNPDGTRKWIFEAPSQGPIGGPGVGPDGNVYAVFDLPGPIGAVSLTPEGTLRWNNLGNPRVGEYGQLGREIVFAKGVMYWTATYFDDLYAFGLAQGRQRFHVDVAAPGQAATDRDGTVYVPTGIAPRLNAYTRTGTFKWSFFGDEPGVTNELSAPDVGRDGTIYIDRNLSELYSLDPTPAVRWISDSLLPQGPVPGPIVGPGNHVVLIGGQETYGRPGLIQAFSVPDGQLLFHIDIPKEPDGTCAVPYARARFAPTGDRAYIPAAQLCEVPDQYHSWLYAIDISA